MPTYNLESSPLIHCSNHRNHPIHQKSTQYR